MHIVIFLYARLQSLWRTLYTKYPHLFVLLPCGIIILIKLDFYTRIDRALYGQYLKLNKIKRLIGIGNQVILTIIYNFVFPYCNSQVLVYFTVIKKKQYSFF